MQFDNFITNFQFDNSYQKKHVFCLIVLPDLKWFLRKNEKSMKNWNCRKKHIIFWKIHFWITNSILWKTKKMRLEICYLDQCLNFLCDPFLACKHHFEILHVVSKELPHQINSKMPLDNSFTKFQTTILLKKNSSFYSGLMVWGF